MCIIWKGLNGAFEEHPKTMSRCVVIYHFVHLKSTRSVHLRAARGHRKTAAHTFYAWVSVFDRCSLELSRVLLRQEEDTINNTDSGLNEWILLLGLR